MPTDLELARSVSPRPITDVAASIGLHADDLILYGEDKAKVRLGAIERLRSGRTPGKLVLVSAITPTAAGEGKTTMTIALGQGLAKLGHSVAIALREPSLGPCLGMKGGATGGGMCQVIPMEDINLHFTGDFHAVSTAHNLLAALLDNHIHRGDRLEIDPRRITWRRVIDMNDRALRDIIIGLGGVMQGVPRESGFDITPASEIMAILCLAESYDDLKERLNRILLAFTYDREPITAEKLGATGAMAALLRDALLPNLVQTMEGVPAFVHGGPFANIAHGCNSVLATRTGLHAADWVVTEAGFGFDLGAEKFFDIKCRSAGLDTVAVVLVATCRALKMHGGVKSRELAVPNPRAVEAGFPNLDKHVENIGKFREPPVVCLNRFTQDTEEEIEVIRRHCTDVLGVPFAVCDAWSRGGEGAKELARSVIAHAEKCSKPFRPLYDWDWPVEKKILTVAREMYGAEEIEYTKEAERDLRDIDRLGYNNLPICIAKTQKSLSDDPSLIGRPEEFTVHVREILISAGAGYLVPLTGDILRMPGLPSSPQAERIDLVDGKITGLE
ncbi:formate--tetrahydrofolate ligase [candidate division TA06 bacterium SM1_40]|uniref:Formate--tetrahydrofolate ligase n=2 Tax=Bacteria division TA06 TaxID=1156500 RepID=A0A0S8JIK6_UNCT6|nr:MAG: formate--tetrahydrofolate ligase [candidate division TA06 bacterium SM23_40]KPL09202.1 MAG: formate--tetrahydrofolate ligase [candidate division TA06 bacterium SM1_40]